MRAHAASYIGSRQGPAGIRIFWSFSWLPVWILWLGVQGGSGARARGLAMEIERKKAGYFCLSWHNIRNNNDWLTLTWLLVLLLLYPWYPQCIDHLNLNKGGELPNYQRMGI